MPVMYMLMQEMLLSLTRSCEKCYYLLGPGIPYNVSVAAVNSAGRGELESVIAFTEEESKHLCHLRL